eukprot:gene25957-2314_t
MFKGALLIALSAVVAAEDLTEDNFRYPGDGTGGGRPVGGFNEGGLVEREDRGTTVAPPFIPPTVCSSQITKWTCMLPCYWHKKSGACVGAKPANDAAPVCESATRGAKCKKLPGCVWNRKGQACSAEVGQDAAANIGTNLGNPATGIISSSIPTIQEMKADCELLGNKRTCRKSFPKVC